MKPEGDHARRPVCLVIPRDYHHGTVTLGKEFMSNAIEVAIRTLRAEALAILDQVGLLDETFEAAVALLAQSSGKLAVTGIGKSGIIGRKISATFASTGTPSFFLHPAEAYHGDLGMLDKGDVVLMLSYSGETDEILRIVPFLKENQNRVIAITGKRESTLARNADIHVPISISNEACPLRLAPTTSTTVTLALGDALAMAVMQHRGFKPSQFARLHPGGSLGRKLLGKVEGFMRTDDLPIVSPLSGVPEVINELSRGRLGLALVNSGDITDGIITDGDLRRLIEREGRKSFDLVAKDFMTWHPKTIPSSASLLEADRIFNEYKITSLVVVDKAGDTVGVIQIYDL